MPRKTGYKREDLEDIEYTSMADYKYKLDEIVDYQEKVQFTTKYLLAYGKDKGEKDYTFEEAVHIARMKLGEASLDLKSKLPDSSKARIKQNPWIVNPNLMRDKDDLANQMFFGNPSLYFAGNDNDQLLDDYVYGNFNERVSEIEKNSNAFDVRYRMATNIGSKKEFEKAYTATKPGFFSKMFNTSSLAYKNFDTVYNAFNNPKHALYGDMNSLEKATDEYLEHKLPNWKKGQPLPENLYAGLDKTEIARVRFCVNIKDAVKEQREKTEGLKEMINACENKKVSFKDIDGPNFIQDMFQNQIKEDLIEDDAVNNPEPEVEKNSNKIEKEDEKEVDINAIDNN